MAAPGSTLAYDTGTYLFTDTIVSIADTRLEILPTAVLRFEGTSVLAVDSSSELRNGSVLLFDAGTRLDNDGAFTNSGGFSFALGAGGAGVGSLLQTAGVMRLDGELALLGGAEFQGGQLTGAGRLHVGAGGLRVGAGATVAANGLWVTGDVGFDGQLELAVASAAGGPLFQVDGDLAFDTGSQLLLSLGLGLADASYDFDLLHATGALSGLDFDQITVQGVGSGYTQQFRQDCDARGCTLSLALTAVAPQGLPEPGAAVLAVLALGAAGLACRRRVR